MNDYENAMFWMVYGHCCPTVNLVIGWLANLSIEKLSIELRRSDSNNNLPHLRFEHQPHELISNSFSNSPTLFFIVLADVDPGRRILPWNISTSSTVSFLCMISSCGTNPVTFLYFDNESTTWPFTIILPPISWNKTGTESKEYSVVGLYSRAIFKWKIMDTNVL